MDNDQLINNTINLEQWLTRNDIFELKRFEHAYTIRKRAEDRFFAEKAKELAAELQNSPLTDNVG